VVGDQLPELADHVEAELEIGVDAQLERDEPQLVQPLDLAGQHAARLELGQRRAARQGERVA
jgi:hypothetical protein